MKLLVTGGGGQLAQCLASEARAAPVLLDRAALDLTDPDSIRTAMREHAPDLVINAAAYTAVDAAEDDPETAMAVNGEGAGRLAEACRTLGARLIHVSTDYVFDGRSSRPWREDDPTAPQGAYGRSKLEGERRVRAAMPDAMIVRTAWVYSPFGRNFVRSILAAAATRPALDVVEDQVGSPTSALDLARALLRIADAPGSGTYHVASSGVASWFNVAGAVMAEAARLGLPSVEVRPIRSDQWPAKAPRPAYSVLDCSRFERDFGFALPDWREGVRETVALLASLRPGSGQA